jgi:hypothetical protein
LPEASFFAMDLWDPFAFIELCQKTGTRRGSERELLKNLQRIEFEKVFEHIWMR